MSAYPVEIDIHRKPRSTQLGFRMMSAAMKLLASRSRPIPLRRIVEELEKSESFSTWDKEVTKWGGVRWQNQLAYHSIDATQADLIRRNRAEGWMLTEKGKLFLAKKRPEDLFAEYWSVRIERDAKRRHRT